LFYGLIFQQEEAADPAIDFLLASKCKEMIKVCEVAALDYMRWPKKELMSYILLQQQIAYMFVHSVAYTDLQRLDIFVLSSLQ